MKNSLLPGLVCLILFAASVSCVFAQTKRRADSARNEPADKVEDLLIGKWTSSEAEVEFLDDDSLTIDGNLYNYAVVGKAIVVESADGGRMEFPFSLKGDTLTVLYEGQKIVYTRTGNDGGGGEGDDEMNERPLRRTNENRAGSSGNRSGGAATPAELAGTWCYQADVFANNGGGRHARICFTLNPNGTYQYQNGSSSSNPYGGTSYESADAGRWTASANSLTAHSNSGETRTYTLEKRNHPKTGDPMLVVDGDAFVTQFQKRPW